MRPPRHDRSTRAYARRVRTVLALIVLSAVAARADAPAPSPCTDDAQLDGPSSKRHAPGVSTRGYVGKTAAQVIAAHGEPGCKSPRKWRYWFPDDCAYEKDVVTLRFANGRVSRATVVHIFTGEECAGID